MMVNQTVGLIGGLTHRIFCYAKTFSLSLIENNHIRFVKFMNMNVINYHNHLFYNDK